MDLVRNIAKYIRIKDKISKASICTESKRSKMLSSGR